MKKEILTINTPFALENGMVLDKLEICYHHTDNFSIHRKLVWICHALTANSNPEEWWDVLVGDGKFFDTQKYTIVCANMLGSCYGTSGPSSFNKHGKQYLLSFPKITVRDIVKAHQMLGNHLQIKTIDLVIGGSIGGFQALEWAIMDPKKIKNLVLIACNARVSPWGTAFNEAQRMALHADFTFIEQKNIHGGKKGLEAARSIALLSYRSYAGYGATQAENNPDTVFPVLACTYQQYQGKKLSDRFDAYSYNSLTFSVDSHNVGRNRGGVQEALSRITANTLVIGIDSDCLFPIQEQVELHHKIKNSHFEQIASAFGHDGFLLEWRSIENAIKKHVNFSAPCKY